MTDEQVKQFVEELRALCEEHKMGMRAGAWKCGGCAGDTGRTV